jgi:hypothetical protein
MSEQTTFKLQTDEPQLQPGSLYIVDFSKCASVEDLVLVFACMGLSFSGSHPYAERIKHLLDLDNPINPDGTAQSQPKPENLKLPKLKSLKENAE